MSWYVGQDGQQIWIQRDEMVYTVVQSSNKLPAENLAYLAVQSKKAVYHEHICEEDLLAEGMSSVPRRRRARQGGRQRGFILRADTEDSSMTRVVPWFKASAQKLIDCDVVSRIDADEAANMKKKKKNDRMMTLLGVNECRIETTARINHFAHGPGFRVEVAEGTAMQKILFFTNRKELPEKDWIACLTAAIQSTGVHVMMARRTQHDVEADKHKQDKDSTEGNDAKNVLEVQMQIKKDKAQQDDDAWFESMMTGCMMVNSDHEEDISDEEDEQHSELDPLTLPKTAQQLVLSSEPPHHEQHPQPQAPKEPKGSSHVDRAPALRLRPEPSRHEHLPWQSLPKEPKVLQEENKPRPERHARDQVNKCAECGRGRPLKLFVDDDDGNWYCRMCWVEFYGLEPPAKV